MTATDRHARIVESLRATGIASVRELAAELRVSESTVRRDLDRLGHDGALVRSYGGAALPPRGTDRPPEAPHRAEKAAMAARAAELVPDDATVLLDTGAGAAMIARRLRGRPVTVITGGVAVLDELRGDPAVRLVLLGGVLRRDRLSLVGSLAEAALRQVGADLAFLGCAGVRPNGQVFDDLEAEAPLRQAMLGAADRRVLVASAREFPGTGSLRLCALTDFDTLVTTTNADPSTVGAYRQAGGKVISV